MDSRRSLLLKVPERKSFSSFKSTLEEGTNSFSLFSLYKSLPSLWGRQIPYTMMKFWSFEATVTQIYKYLGQPKDSYNKLQQLGVSFAGGYIAGVFCAIVSQFVLFSPVVETN